MRWGGDISNGTLWTCNFNEIKNESTAVTSMAYSDVKGSNRSGGSWNTLCGMDGFNNIDADPQLLDDARCDYRSYNISSAIGAGSMGQNMGNYQGSGETAPITLSIRHVSPVITYTGVTIAGINISIVDEIPANTSLCQKWVQQRARISPDHGT